MIMLDTGHQNILKWDCLWQIVNCIFLVGNRHKLDNGF